MILQGFIKWAYKFILILISVYMNIELLLKQDNIDVDPNHTLLALLSLQTMLFYKLQQISYDISLKKWVYIIRQRLDFPVACWYIPAKPPGGEQTLIYSLYVSTHVRPSGSLRSPRDVAYSATSDVNRLNVLTCWSPSPWSLLFLTSKPTAV